MLAAFTVNLRHNRRRLVRVDSITNTRNGSRVPVINSRNRRPNNGARIFGQLGPLTNDHVLSTNDDVRSNNHNGLQRILLLFANERGTNSSSVVNLNRHLNRFTHGRLNAKRRVELRGRTGNQLQVATPYYVRRDHSLHEIIHMVIRRHSLLGNSIRLGATYDSRRHASDLYNINKESSRRRHNNSYHNNVAHVVSTKGLRFRALNRDVYENRHNKGIRNGPFGTNTNNLLFEKGPRVHNAPWVERLLGKHNTVSSNVNLSINERHLRRNRHIQVVDTSRRVTNYVTNVVRRYNAMVHFVTMVIGVINLNVNGSNSNKIMFNRTTIKLVNLDRRRIALANVTAIRNNAIQPLSKATSNVTKVDSNVRRGIHGRKANDNFTIHANRNRNSLTIRRWDRGVTTVRSIRTDLIHNGSFQVTKLSNAKVSGNQDQDRVFHPLPRFGNSAR